MSETKHRRSSVLSTIILLIGVVLFGALVLNHQFIVDYVRSSQYVASTEAAAIRRDLDLTDKGNFYYNASQPAIEPASRFNANCRQTSETNNPILGCYDAQKIYIFDVTNQKLSGIEETTAAHELLHAVYERLSESERKSIDSELDKTYQAHRTPELESRMDYYRKTEPGQEMNELHSILGTEVNNLGTSLESHYSKYFKNRKAVVAFYEKYSGVFDSVKNRMQELSSSINSQTPALNARIDNYNQSAKQLQADADAFKKRNQSGEITSLTQFNSQQNALLARQAALDNERQAITAQAALLNNMRIEYNRLVDEYNQLNVSINSNLTPVKTLE